MAETVPLRARFGSGEDFPRGRADHQPSGGQQQRFDRQLLQLMPKVIGTLDQGDIEWMFEIRFADDASLAMGGTRSVWRAELIESEHSLSASRQMERRRAAHRPQAHHNDVERRAHATDWTPSRSKLSKLGCMACSGDAWDLSAHLPNEY